MGSVVVHNNVHVEFRWHLRLDHIQEAAKFHRTMLVL